MRYVILYMEMDRWKIWTQGNDLAGILAAYKNTVAYNIDWTFVLLDTKENEGYP